MDNDTTELTFDQWARESIEFVKREGPVGNLTQQEVIERNRAHRAKLQEESASKEAIILQFPSLDAYGLSDEALTLPETPTSEAWQSVDDALLNVTTLEVYDSLFSNLSRQEVRGRTENVMAQCPNQANHERGDQRKSAWFGSRKGDWFINCGGCEQGWDKYSLAGLAYGLDSRGNDFPEIRKRLAKDLKGVDFIETSSPYELQNTLPATSEPLPPQAPEVKTTLAPVNPTDSEPQLPLTKPKTVPTYKIHEVLPEGNNFLRSYYDATVQDETPDEYQLWCGLIALAVAVGRNVTMEDFLPVTANLGICLIGNTAAGKSRSVRHLENLLAMDERLHWKPGKETGVKFRQSVSSAPYLIAQFSDVEKIGDNVVHHPVKMILVQDELSALIAKGNSRDNNHGTREVILQLLDGKDYLHTGSKTGGDHEARNGFAALIGGIQPDAIADVFSNSDMVTGFMNRLIFVPGAPVNRSHRGGKQIDLTAPSSYLSDILGWSVSGIHITEWEPAADALWKEAFETKVQPLQQDNRWSAILGRLDLNMKRLVMLFAANDRSSEILLPHVQSAVALLDYMIECYAKLIEYNGDRTVKEAEKKILNAVITIQNKPDYPGYTSIRFIQQVASVRESGKRWTRKDYEETIKAMADEGLIELQKHVTTTKQGAERHVQSVVLTESGLVYAQKE